MLSARRIARSQHLSPKPLRQSGVSRPLADYSRQRQYQNEQQQPGENDVENQRSEATDESKGSDERAEKHSNSSKSKSTGQTDEELRENLEKMMSNDGGLAGVELEGGEPVGLTRGVRNNMFRLI